ncbi:MAG: transglycosylase SLT domain-containing protein [Bryobacteraceae bacterium]
MVLTAANLSPIVPNPYLTSPTFLKPRIQMPPRPTATDQRLRRAEEHFQKGKKLYLEGGSVDARVEFDAAIDLLLATPEDAEDRFKAEARLDHYVTAIYKLDVNGLGAGDFSQQVAYDKAPLEDILEMTFPVAPGLKPVVKEQLLATSSQIPLELTDPVLSYINYFSTDRGRRTLVSGLQRSGRYKPMIQRILAEEGVPQELIYLAQAESGFLPRAVSNKAAVGMWQFIRSRGQEYGLMQTAYSDDRLDPEKATRSAARHLRDLYNKFGDWYLAIAAYNCGDGCVERAVTRTGYADFWYLRSHNAIPKETTNYVPIIVAMTIMHKNAKAYGIENITGDSPLLYESMEFDTPTHLALIADASDRPVSEIKDLNPALLTSVAPAHYPVRVPTGTRTMILAGLEPIPDDRRASWRIHRVVEGDTIESIAKRYRTPMTRITSTNSAVEAEVGDVLVIPRQRSSSEYR